MTVQRMNRIRSATVGGMVLTMMALTGCHSEPAQTNVDLAQGAVSDVRFRERVDAEMPGVFKPEREGRVTVASIARFHCGALERAQNPEAAEAEGADDLSVYQDGAGAVREHLISLWADDIGRGNAITFVDMSTEILCPELPDGKAS